MSASRRSKDKAPRANPKVVPARMAMTSARRVAAAARSGLRRYPRALLESVREFTDEAPRGPVADALAALPDLNRHALATVWLGHATVLVRLAGLNVLMDPVMAHRIGFSIGPLTLGLPRLTPAPVTPEQLPAIDLILISHAHFDHLDKPTLRRLARPSTTVITAHRTRRLIPSGFGDVIELNWGQEHRFRGLHLTALRPAHWGARAALDRRRGYNSYLIRTDDHGLLFAGDTAMTDAFDKLDDLTLAVMGIGAYEPWDHAHSTPEQTWAMFQSCSAEHLLPVHHSTFPLGDEHIDEPMRRLLAAAGEHGHRVIRAAPGALWAR